MKSIHLVTFLFVLTTVFFSVSPLGAGPERVPVGLLYTQSQCAHLRDGKDDLLQYRQALEFAGASVVVLSPFYANDVNESQKKQIKGLLLPGGIDIDPKYHNEKRHEKLRDTNEILDEFEFSLIKYAMEKELPILGICRGEQVMAVHFGGSLYQDIPSQYHGRPEVIHQAGDDKGHKPTWHMVNIEKNTLLYSMLGHTSMEVNSSHHEAVNKMPRGFKVSATAPDGIIEGFESTSSPFVVAVQFHPERLRMEDPTFDALFTGLVEEARKKMKTAATGFPAR